MLKVFEVGKELFLLGIQYFWEHKIIMAILIAICGFTLFLVIKGLRSVFRSNANLLFRIVACAYIIVSVAIVMFTGSACLVASDIYEASPELFSTRLYILVIVLSIIGGVLEAAVLKANRVGPDDLWESTKRVIKAGIVVIGSIVFIFTDLEFALMGFGPTIFNRTIGEWIFNFYSGLAVMAILGLVQFLLTWPLLPWFAVGMNAIDEA